MEVTLLATQRAPDLWNANHENHLAVCKVKNEDLRAQCLASIENLTTALTLQTGAGCRMHMDVFGVCTVRTHQAKGCS